MIKILHETTALISLSLFVVRGLGHFRQAAFMRRRWVRIVPHVNDSLLLLSAILLTVQIGQYPFTDGWLTAKLLALVVYILLGMVALKWARSQSLQVAAWLVALLVFGYIVSVAVSKQPLGFFLPLLG